MGTNSDIEWTDATWNPLAGCTRASAGCDNCYAAVMAWRLGNMARADLAAGREPGGRRKYLDVATKTPSGRVAFNGTINLDESALDEPRTWRKPRRVFVNSMSDLFHKDVHPGFIYQVFKVMEETPQHTYQVLTKRPENIMPAMRLYGIGGATPQARPWPANVWIGTSVEDQRAAEERIPHLLKVPARVRFLSCEPLLGPVDLGRWVKAGGEPLDWTPDGDAPPGDYNSVLQQWETRSDDGGINWVIAGGESGPRSRPMEPAWAESLRDQCRDAGVAFYMKQMGRVVAGKGKGGDVIPEGLMIREFPV